MTTHQIENLAVMFRLNDPNIFHVSTFESMEKLGLLFYLGVLNGTPKNHQKKRWEIRQQIGRLLEQKAKDADLLHHLETLAKDCEQNLKDIGGCDHSVGICCCDEIRNLEQAREAIKRAKGLA